MKNIFFWLLYYIKCAFNIVYSYFGNNNIKKENIEMVKVSKYLYKVSLCGNYFEMGKQYGEVMKKILIKDVKILINFLKDNQHIFNKKIPEKYKKQNIFESLIALYNDNVEHYNKDIIEFTKGVSETTKIEYNKLMYATLFPDITDNHCILLSKILDKKKLNLRTFDLGCPQLTHTLFVFNPINGNKYISLNVSICFGLVTGISEKNIFFGESYCDTKLGNISYQGMPFHHISHKILKLCNNLNEGEEVLKKCNRTSNLDIMLCDNTKSKIFQSCKDKFEIEKEGDYVYSLTPNEKKNFETNKNYLIDIENIIKKFIPKTKSGELHIMVSYNRKIYISVTTNVLQSYNNTFYEFDLGKIFDKNIST
tara:strand:- start:3883 stop:4980 length:1098 start_codon:yes stop_codon:yes gene_type:complete